MVERRFNGPAHVSGSAGTGKTIVALHRAAHLARTQPQSRVLLTTFCDALASALRKLLHRLLAPTPQVAENVEVASLQQVAGRLFRPVAHAALIVSDSKV